MITSANHPRTHEELLKINPQWFDEKNEYRAKHSIEYNPTIKAYRNLLIVRVLELNL